MSLDALRLLGTLASSYKGYFLVPFDSLRSLQFRAWALQGRMAGHSTPSSGRSPRQSRGRRPWAKSRQTRRVEWWRWGVLHPCLPKTQINDYKFIQFVFWSVSYELAKYWLLSWQFVWNIQVNTRYFIARIMTSSPKFRAEFWVDGRGF